MEFRTAISKMTDDDLIIRGKKHSSMVGHWSFSKSIFFLLTGKEPGEREEHLFDAMLTLVIDHGMGTASSMAARGSASTGNTLNAALASGILALGPRHGGAVSAAMRLFQELEGTALPAFVTQALREKRRLPGYGHKVYKQEDPRTRLLTTLCEKHHYPAPTLQHALALEAELARQGKRLVLNIDGAIGALLSDLGFLPELGDALFLIGRTPGLVAQALEEQARGVVWRLDEDEIVYEGASVAREE